MTISVLSQYASYVAEASIRVEILKVSALSVPPLSLKVADVTIRLGILKVIAQEIFL